MPGKKEKDMISMGSQALDRFSWGGDPWDAEDDPALIVEERECDLLWARNERKEIEALIAEGKLEGRGGAIEHLDNLTTHFWMDLPENWWALETMSRLKEGKR